MSLPQHLRERVLEQARRAPSPTRPALIARTLLLVVAGVVAAVAFWIGIGGVRGTPRPTALMIGTVIGWSAVALLAAWSAWSRGHSTLGRPRWWLIASVAVTPLALFAWKMLWSLQFEGMTIEWPKRFGFKCFALTLAFAAWPLVSLALLRRGTDPIHPSWFGAALGIASGACAGILVDLWCPVAYPVHVLFGHILPILILGACGAVLGRLVIGVRRR